MVKSTKIHEDIFFFAEDCSFFAICAKVQKYPGVENFTERWHTSLSSTTSVSAPFQKKQPPVSTTERNLHFCRIVMSRTQQAVIPFLKVAETSGNISHQNWREDKHNQILSVNLCRVESKKTLLLYS